MEGEQQMFDRPKTESETYLESGPQTPLNGRVEEIKIKGEGKEYIEDAMRWIHSKLTPNEEFSTKMQVFRQRDSNQIIEDGFVTGCTDIAHVFASLTRKGGIPTRYVETIDKSSEDGSVGHVYAECFVDDKWIKVDPTFRTISDDLTYPGSDVIAVGLDSKDCGTDSFEKIREKTAEFRSSVL
jgi:transglutaminase-like putative cysteine protease